MSELNEGIISPAATFRALTRIEAKQDLILERYNGVRHDLEKLQDQVCHIERKQTYATGALAVLAVMAAFVSEHVRDFF